MMSKPVSKEENHLFSLMNEQKLRKAVSDVSSEIEKIRKDMETIAKIEEVEQAECKCCGLKEDCTQDYIAKTKDCYSGNWVCGLCSEVVKERLKKGAPRIAIEEAVNTQRNVCQEFNRVRLNPKLSLTCAMRNIAKRNCERRNSNNSSTSTIVRSTSCVPRIDFDINS